MIYLGSFMPVYAFINLSRSTFAGKVLASLLSPCAFGLTTEVIFTLESAGIGATTNTAGVLYRVFSVNAGIGMMVFDTFLYSALALYIEQVRYIRAIVKICSDYHVPPHCLGLAVSIPCVRRSQALVLPLHAALLAWAVWHSITPVSG